MPKKPVRIPLPHTSPTAGIPNRMVGRTPGRTPWSARDALIPPLREESVDCDHRRSRQGVGWGRGRPPIAITRKRGKLGALGSNPAAVQFGNREWLSHLRSATFGNSDAVHEGVSSGAPLACTVAWKPTRSWWTYRSLWPGLLCHAPISRSGCRRRTLLGVES